jgi:hypothetical protein
VLNVLFSIGGAGGAVYVAAVTGAGYSRELGVILGLIAATVVGVAEMVLLWIFVWRVKEGRKKGIEQWKGSSGIGVKEREVAGLIEGEDGGGADGEEGTGSADVENTETVKVGGVEKSRTEVRLRRRAIGSVNTEK